jgi:Zn-dependent protease/CBS domain-containing protein
MGLGTALAFFTSVVLHELGHALVARAVHIPIRGITLFLFGGIAEMEDEPRSAASELLMAVAGPVVSAVLSGFFWFLSGLVESPAIVFPLRYLAIINLGVLIFNMVPAFPLDGGRVLRSTLWRVLGNLRQATYWASLAGQAFAWLLIALGIVHFSVGLYIQGIWLVLIGLFLKEAAREAYKQLLVRQALGGEHVSRFMTREPIVVKPELDLRHWVDDYVLRYHRKMFPVAANDHLEGIIATQALEKYPREEWDRHTVAEAMQQNVDALTIPADTDALQALGKMQRVGSSRLLITEGDSLRGIITLRDMLRFLDLKLSLQDGESESRTFANKNQT